MLRPLSAIAVAILLTMSVFETVKQFLFPQITLLQSHILTVLFATFVGLVIASFILLNRKRFQRYLNAQVDERNKAEARSERMARLYAALSQCNQAIVRSTTQEELFQKVCRAAVQSGGFRMAWIGIVSPLTQAVSPVSQYGENAAAYLQDIKINRDADSPFGQGPTGIAIRENRPYWCQDFQHDPITAPWHERGAQFNFAASASLPLHKGNAVIGAFTLYSSVCNDFDEQARSLILEMAADISYALENFEREASRKEMIAVTNSLLELSTTEANIDERALLQQGLDKLQNLTASQIGFLHFVHEDQNEIELVTWSSDTLQHYCQAAYDSHYPVATAGIWADCIRTRQPVIINDYASASGKKGLPDGHAAMQRFISVPVVENEKVCMILGVGNAPRDYVERDVEIIKLFSYELYHLAQHKRATSSLAESEQRLRAITQSANDAIITASSTGHIVSGNTAAERLFGYTSTEFNGLPLTALIPERFQNAHQDGLARLVAGGEPRVIGKTVELVGLHKNKREFPLEMSLAHWSSAGKSFFTAIIRDITTRKNREQELQSLLENSKQSRQVLLSMIEDKNRVEDSLRKLSLAVEQSPNSIVITDINANIEYVNEAFVKATGYSRTEVIGQNPRILHSEKHPNDKSTYDDMWAHLIQGIAWKGELLNQRKDGTEYIESVWISPVRQPDGRVTNYLAIKADITEQKTISKSLSEKDAFLHTLIETIPDLICVKNVNGIYLSCNPTFELYFGIREADIIGKTDYDFVDKELADSFRKYDQLVMSTRKPSINEEWVTEANTGQRVLLETVKTPMFDATGKLTGVLGISRNITERKLMEAEVLKLNVELENKVAARTSELKKKEEEIRSVVDHMLDCVITIDEQGIICSANPSVEKMFGYRVDEVVGQNVSMLMFAQDRLSHEHHLGKIVKNGSQDIIGISRQVEGRHKNGTPIALELGVSEYFVQGQHFYTGILRDIRERVRIMAELEHARVEAEEANRAKSAFLATMSHEIRTPMNGVVGMIDVLQQTSLTGEQMEMSNIIHDSAFALLSIIDDILDFSKIEAGKLKIEELPISIEEVVENACETLVPLALKKGAELTLFTDPGIPPSVMGDPVRLRQILINLTNNAIKFSSGLPRQGKVSVRALCLEHSAEEAILEFHIIDNGIGIEKAVQDKLFSVFTQADSSTTRHFGGTGLGLAISRQLTNIMGGKIWVKSEPGLGSTFSVRITFRMAAAQPASQPSSTQVAGLQCMVVGKTHYLADDLALYLRHGGAQVERVVGLNEATQWLSRQPAGLYVIIIDTEGVEIPLASLHHTATMHPELELRILLIERGGRRHCRITNKGLLGLDAEVMHRHEFLNTVAVIAGRSERHAEHPPSNEHMIIKPPSQAEARRLGQLILVAEDNDINQKVLQQQLTLIGRVADVASDGEEAFELWQKGHYGLLLTDLHMPKMDGYELTTAIRASEQQSASRKTNNQRFPIIAISANALKGEADHCKSIGMDDYLSKPVKLNKLKEMLDKWLPLVSPPLAAVEPDIPSESSIRVADISESPESVAVDVKVLKELIGDDDTLVREFLNDFRNSANTIAGQLRAACAAKQTATAGAHAHKLKSSARSVGALALGELCFEMEKAGKNDDMAALSDLLPKFETELAQVEKFLAEY